MTGLLVGCSSSESRSSKSSDKQAFDSAEMNTDPVQEAKVSKNETQATPSNTNTVQNRKVIYTATLNMDVKKINQTQEQISVILTDMKGYILEENMDQEEQEQKVNTLTVRVPQQNFNSFLKEVKKLGIRTNSQRISGQDVTEQYVDLNSRLKSKQVTEKRLIDFMNDAKDTKTLLEISNELSRVQEEMETIEGQMKYLKNQSDLSTITITLHEDSVIVPGLENGQLNTWDKTKKQFMKSINFIVSFCSGLFVLVIGNIPVLIILGLIAMIAVILYKRFKKQSNNTIGK